MATPKKPHQYLYRNWVSYAGGIIAVIGLLLVLFAVLLSFGIHEPGPYVGIFTFVLFPSIIAGGLFLVLIGMRVEARRRVKTGIAEALPYPAIDLNDPKMRKRFALVAGAGALLLMVFSFAGYNGFLLTESVGFCGETCHVMKPEHTAYLNSPHARVRCVECHVGEGAGYYVHSKLAGVRQLIGVVTGNYERPIPTPVHDLRPARETCLHCHWPEKFGKAQLYQRPHFRYDEKNSAEQITMLIKTGGGGENGAGIHWHMFIENEVEYVSTDSHLQEIPWFKVSRRKDGSSTEYTSTERPLNKQQIDGMLKHKMDCMDCHNRPAHGFEPPDIAVDRALTAGNISTTLPFAKSMAVDALSREYADAKAAHEGLKNDVTAFYAKKYPDIAATRVKDIEQAIATVIAIYDRNVFPEMKVSWNTYPSNIGHRNWPGCFRCHDGKHQTPDGKVLTNECKLCHTEPMRGPQSGMGESMRQAEQSWHPWETPEKHLAIKKHLAIPCYECHLAGRRPKTECKDCHH
jgi:hypothetical protein